MQPVRRSVSLTSGRVAELPTPLKRGTSGGDSTTMQDHRALAASHEPPSPLRRPSSGGSGAGSRKHSMTRLPDEAPGGSHRAAALASGASTPVLSKERRLGSQVLPVAGPSGSTAACVAALGRPASAGSAGLQRPTGLVRLPDEPGVQGASVAPYAFGAKQLPLATVVPCSAANAVTTPPGLCSGAVEGGDSSSSRSKASLARLPNDAGGNGDTSSRRPSVTSATSANSAPGAVAPVSGPSSNAAGDALAPPPSLIGQRRASEGSKLRDRLNKNLTVTTLKGQGEAKNKVFRVLGDDENINDIYDFGEELYSGGSKGKVLIAKRRTDGIEVVVKIRAKNVHKSGERTWRAIMTQLQSLGGSQHVLDITEIIESKDAFFVVMPKCNGGELFEFLATETEVPEAECKRIIREILIAVGHLHKNNLVHRDIKPENIMFQQDADLGPSPKTVKLIDFDTCLEWTPMTPKSRRFVGTPGYIAPEALLGEISPQSDLWSIGVILYILMTGEMPWSSLVSLEDGVVGSPGATRMYDAIKKEVLQWEQEPWPDFPQACDLCQKLLAFNLEVRIPTVQAALEHPWLAG